MAIQRDGYYYNQQLRNYILQFMAIFNGLQVQVGKWNTEDERLISVPIRYSHIDRVVASILSDNTQNKPLRLPIMSAYMRNLSLNKEYMAGTGMEHRIAYTPVGGLVQQDTTVVHQRRPVPYKLEMELCLYASNTDQHFQMLEQILPLFDPTLSIQVSDSVLDMKRLTILELNNIGLETNLPISTDRRICQSTLSFEMPIWFDTPVDIRKDFIQKIFMRIGAVSAGVVGSYEIVADLDGQGIDYELTQDASDLTVE